MSLATGRLATGTVRGQTGIASGNAVGHGIIPTSLNQIPEGKITATIYSFIRDGRYQDVIKILSNETQSTRACLSLLGYCYYQIQEYHTASDWFVFALIF
jgi:tetratricopeptide repeat protein 30